MCFHSCVVRYDNHGAASVVNLCYHRSAQLGYEHQSDPLVVVHKLGIDSICV